MFFYFYGVRSYAGLDSWSLWKVIFPLAVFFFFPQFLDRPFKRFFALKDPRPISLIVTMLGYVVLSFLLGALVYVFFLAAAIAIHRKFRNQQFSDAGLSKINIAVLCVALVSLFVCIANAVWQSGYLSPFFFEQFGNGIANTDTLSHVAYTVMIEKYQAVTVGIHGLAQIRYHLGVHTFLLAVGKSLGEDAGFTFNVVYPILVLPLLMQAIWGFGRTFSPAQVSPERKSSDGVLILALLSALVVQLFEYKRLDRYGLRDSYFISGSYAMSLLLATYFVWALTELLRNKSLTPKEEPLALSIFTLLVLPFFLGCIVFAKVSTGFVCASALGLYTLFSLRRGRWTFNLLLLFLSAITAFLANQFSAKSISNPLSWNYFITNYGVNFAGFYSHFYYHFWIAIVLSIFLWIIRTKINFESWKPFLFLVSAAVSCFVITWPAIHFNIAGGSGYYFLNVTMWFSLYVIFAALALILTYEHLRKVFAGLVILSLYFSLSNFTLSARSLEALPVTGKMNLSQNLAPNQFRDFLVELRKLRDLPKDFLIYIPQSETEFWYRKGYDQLRVSLAIPVLSEHPAIFGVSGNQAVKESPATEFWLGSALHYWNYPENPDQTQICAEARKFSFSRYVQLNWDESSGRVKTQEHSCQ
jgi:hypothetical protein